MILKQFGVDLEKVSVCFRYTLEMRKVIWRWMGDGSGMVQERQKDYFSMV